MPFLETGAAARSCRVLCDEHRMTLERRLLSVIGGERGCETSADKIGCVLENGGHVFRTKILKLFRAQSEVAAKGGAFQRGENFVEVSQCYGETTVPK